MPNNLKSRKANRLKNYDYSQNGAYFVTVCVQNKLRLFGDVVGGKMVLNDAGEMIKKWWLKLENKFFGLSFDEYIVMPDHFHWIVMIDNVIYISDKPTADKHVGLSLPNVMWWFKTMTTNEYILGVKNKRWNSFDKKLWQRSYYDHIIRNETSLKDVRTYIIENPIKREYSNLGT